MKFGYARVSTTDKQTLARQIEALKEQGIEEKNIFTDKMSGAKTSRPGLDDMLSRLREGDAVVVLSFDRLSRSMKQLLELVDQFQKMNVDFISLHESIDTSSPQGKLFFTISAAFAQYERELIQQRVQEGVEIAKAEGRMTGRPKTSKATMDKAIALYEAGNCSVKEIAETLGISRSSLYNELKKRGISQRQPKSM